MRGHAKKRVLLIAPLFFGYYQEIQAELEYEGYDVTYVCDAPSNSNISKAVARVSKRLILASTEKYFRAEVLPRVETERYDIVFVVAGMTFAFTADMMEQLRKKQPDARFIMYQWDSERNLPYAASIHHCFDRLFSFDMEDCRRDGKYAFLPLFYTRMYENIAQAEPEQLRYDCVYIGTAHPKKFREISEMAAALKAVMPRQFIFHYMPSKLKFLYQRILSPDFRGARYSELQHERLSPEEIRSVLEQSACILDAPQKGQTGLTIRTLEALGARRKLVTTNADIRRYDFYREENILVFDGKIDAASPFFTQGYRELPEELYSKYSLRSWLRQMLQDA